MLSPPFIIYITTVVKVGDNIMSDSVTINVRNLRAFDGGLGPQFATAYKIAKNESITSVTLWLTHTRKYRLLGDDGSIPWLKDAVNTEIGRKVKCAIWVNKGSNWSICKKPTYTSSNVTLPASAQSANLGDGIVDTNQLPLVGYDWNNAGTFTECTFTFNTGEIDATEIYIGLISEDSTITTGAIAYRANPDTCVDYVTTYPFDENKPQTYAQTVISKGIYAEFETQSVLNTDSYNAAPMLKLRNVKYRTLSFQTNDKSSNYDSDKPDATCDATTVIKETGDPNHTTSGRYQWDTSIEGSRYNLQFQGFDFSECNLKDTVLFKSGDDTDAKTGTPYNQVSSYNSQDKPFWVHSRSRILITFDCWNSQSGSDGYSKIWYAVKGGQSDALPSLPYTEIKNNPTTLLICPRDEGVSDNEMMEVTIYRQRYSWSDKPVGQQVSMKLVFNTFVTPSVRIAYPKPHRNKLPNGTFEEQEHNYVLWANDYLLDSTGAITSAGKQICDVLNMMLTKDGGDNSGYPIFTRFSIAEFNCGIDSSSTTTNTEDPNAVETARTKMKQLNDRIEGSPNPLSLPECTAYYSGLQLDDGSLIQLSGMIPNGLNWDYMKDEKTGVDINSEEAVHKVITKHGDDGAIYYSWDWRICFRAGYKYYIRIRRFHSAVAGAIGVYGTSGYSYHADHNIPYVSGGAYYYGVGDNVTDNYGGADGTYDAVHNVKGYPLLDGVLYTSSQQKEEDIANGLKWLQYNNHLTEGKWVGPGDGTAASPGVSVDENAVYPGFSTVDDIVIDCLPAVSSKANIIVPRPGVQEIGADKWLTFAYDHIGKSFSGVDESCALNPGVLSGKRNPDGTYMASEAIRAMTNNSKGTWGGNANTLYRIYQMYKHIVDYTAKHIPFSQLDGNINVGDCGRILKRRVIIRLDRQLKNIFNEEQQKLTGDAITDKYRAPYTFLYGDESLNSDNSFNSSIVLADYFLNGSSTPTNLSIPTNGYRNILSVSPTSILAGDFSTSPGANGSAARVFFDPHVYGSDDTPCYGNSLKWVPIINGANYNHKTNSVTNLKLKGTANGPVDVNNIKAVTGEMFTASDNNGPGIDTSHCVYDTNTYQTTLSHFSGIEADITKFCINEYGGQLTYPGEPCGGILYTTPGDRRSQGSSENYDLNPKFMPSGATIPDDYGSGGVQYFNEDSKQQSPGELYKRVPVAFDCENGIPTYNRKISPLSDVVEPIVRTSHMLYFQTYVFGRITYDVFYEYTPSHTESDGEISWCVEDDATTDLPNGFNITDEVTDEWVDNVAATGRFNRTATGGIGKTVTDKMNNTFNNILTVYGEDNNGEGRCLSADDSTAVWYGNNSNDLSTVDMDGAIEYPIKVRYTPLAQPIITLDSKIAGSSWDFTNDFSGSRNIISLDRYYTECNTSNKDSSRLWNNSSNSNNESTSKYLTISYGMYNSAYNGRYISSRKKDPNFDDELYMNPKYQLLVNRRFVELSTSDTEIGNAGVPGNVKAIQTDEDSLWINQAVANSTHTDLYPSVGICNCFTVLLFPSDAVDGNGKAIDYTRQTPNWFSNSHNYWEIRSSSIPDAGVVVVAEKQFTESYKAPGNSNTPTISGNLTTTQTDHQLRTIYHCEFNFTRLVDTGKPNTPATSKESKGIELNTTMTSEHRLHMGVNYDLVIIPVYTNDPAVNTSGELKVLNFEGSTAGGKGGYISTTKNGTPQYYGSDSSDGTTENLVDYYGSTPLVVNKFITISNIVDNKGKKRNETSGTIENCPGPDPGDDRDPDPDPDLEDKSIYTEPAIIYPNINTTRFRYGTGKIHECPGFWLNNTFKVILRGPHFRTRAQIDNDPSSSAEISLEEMAGKNVKPEDYRISDIQIHFGKYDGPVLVTNDRCETWEETDDIFNSKDFQELLDEKENDAQWLNIHNIYSMSHNPGAFSKCTPEQSRAANYNSEDKRDLILGGSMSPENAEEYAKRFVEFDPYAVKAGTAYDEGYYIQFRFKSNEYTSNGIISGWSGWYSGFINDKTKDESLLSYCVPVRNFNNVVTEFQHFIKESYPGSGIKDRDEPHTDPAGNTTSKGIIGVRGTGGPLYKEPINRETTPEIKGAGNSVGAPIVPDTEIPDYRGNINDTDVPYYPQIWSNETSSTGNKTNYPKLNTEAVHSIYWEINYVDYIIRNMAKLYYSEWNGAYIDTNGISPEDLGWTKGMQTYYNGSVDWTAREINPDYRGVSPDNQTSEYKSVPPGLNRYFRRTIRKDDFEHLLDVLKHLTSFMRSTKFTGTHPFENDPAKSPIFNLTPDLSDSKLDKRDNGEGTDKGFIGANLEPKQNLEGSNEQYTMAHTRTAPNYIQQLWAYITGYICKQ